MICYIFIQVMKLAPGNNKIWKYFVYEAGKQYNIARLQTIHFNFMPCV